MARNRAGSVGRSRRSSRRTLSRWFDKAAASPKSPATSASHAVCCSAGRTSSTRAARRAALPGSGRRRAQAEEVRQLQQKLRDVTEERDILKKALAYFADDQK